jgi:hypothetical protein
LSEHKKQEKESSTESDDIITILGDEVQEILEKRPPNSEILEFYIPDEASEEIPKHQEAAQASKPSEENSKSA